MNSKMVYIAGFAIIAILVLATLAYGASQGFEFGGADDGAEGVVEEVDPGYEPWWNGIFGDYELPVRPRACCSRSRPPSAP